MMAGANGSAPNPDPTSTHGKDAAQAKKLELQGWPYPRHLKDRFFSVVVHGDVEGASGVRRALSDWLRFMELRPAGNMSELDRYIGYYGSYAESHALLDRDHAVQDETRNVARAVARAVRLLRAGRLPQPDAALSPARPK